MGQRRRVLLALHPVTAATLRLPPRSADHDVVRHCRDVAELVAACVAGVGDVAVVEASLVGLDRGTVRALHEAGATVVGVVGTGPDAGEGDDAARLRRLGVDALLPAAAPPRECVDAVLTTRAAAVAGPRGREPSAPLSAPGAPRSAHWREVSPADLDAWLAPRPGRVVTVWGPTGAPGRTTVAVTLAGLVAEAGRRVLLVDADPYGGGVAVHLGLPQESSTLVRAVAAAEDGRLDAALLRRLSEAPGPIPRVLTGIPDPARWPQLRPAGLEEVLRVARRVADVVLVDAGFCVEDDEELSYDTHAPRRNGATLASLAAADHVVVVGQGGPLSLSRLLLALDALDALEAGSAAPAGRTVVANRARAGELGSDPAGRVRDALRRLGRGEEPLVVPDDQLRVDVALVEHRPLTATAPGGPVCRALRPLALGLPRGGAGG